MNERNIQKEAVDELEKGDTKMKNNNNTTKGIGFTGLLTISFIVLKLTGVISWSWLWVLSPIWISAILVIIVFAICLWLFK